MYMLYCNMGYYANSAVDNRNGIQPVEPSSNNFQKFTIVDVANLK